ncbi:hypothetical protein [Butyrivibrio sp. FC2001]|nr:hypothetical protein [Butyrivibrio sp. FC2001]
MYKALVHYFSMISKDKKVALLKYLYENSMKNVNIDDLIRIINA